MATFPIVELLAMLVTGLSLRWLLLLAPNIKLVDYPGDRRRLHREAVPRIGGIAVFAGLLASLVAMPTLTLSDRYGLAGAIPLVLVGAINDRHPLSARARLLAQMLAGLLLTLGGGVVITSLGDLLGNGPVLLGAWAVPFTLLAIVGLINAFNMIDGIDGLAGGLTVITLGSLLFFLPAESVLHHLLSGTLAALVPYLICNLELAGCRCKVFLGDGKRSDPLSPTLPRQGGGSRRISSFRFLSQPRPQGGVNAYGRCRQHTVGLSHCLGSH